MREVFRMGAVLTRPSRRVHYRVLYSAAWAFGERNKEEKKKKKKNGSVDDGFSFGIIFLFYFYF